MVTAINVYLWLNDNCTLAGFTIGWLTCAVFAGGMVSLRSWCER